jgi:hypothetical protein
MPKPPPPPAARPPARPPAIEVCQPLFLDTLTHHRNCRLAKGGGGPTHRRL